MRNPLKLRNPLFVFPFLLFLAIAADATTLPNLTGKWQLNRELSDDARQKLENALRNSFTSNRRGTGTSEDARDKEREQTRRRIEALIDASDTLEIKQGEKDLTVTEGDLRQRKLYFDGRPYQRQDRRGNPVTMRVRWRGERLVVSTQLADGGKFTETYELAPQGRQLIVTFTSADPRLRQPLVIYRVYDSVDEKLGRLGNQPFLYFLSI